MWCKFFCILFLLSCTKLDSKLFEEPIDLNIKLLTPSQQEPFSIMKYEFEKMFNIQPSQLKCDLEISIKYRTTNAGIASTAFAINQTLILTTSYVFKCNNEWKLEKTSVLTNEFTQQQEQTVGQYVAEKHFLEEISKLMAKEIYDEIGLFILLKRSQ